MSIESEGYSSAEEQEAAEQFKATSNTEGSEPRHYFSEPEDTTDQQSLETPQEKILGQQTHLQSVEMPQTGVETERSILPIEAHRNWAKQQKLKAEGWVVGGLTGSSALYGGALVSTAHLPEAATWALLGGAFLTFAAGVLKSNLIGKGIDRREREAYREQDTASKNEQEAQ